MAQHPELVYGRVGSAYLTSLISLKILVEALIKPVQVLNASDAIQPALADLLSVPRDGSR